MTQKSKGNDCHAVMQNNLTQRFYAGSLEARVGIEPTMAELQSTALPLCYRALILSKSAGF